MVEGSLGRPKSRVVSRMGAVRTDSPAQVCHSSVAVIRLFQKNVIGGRAYALAARRTKRRSMWPSFDSTKSAMRGAISARKREPLNTP